MIVKDMIYLRLAALDDAEFGQGVPAPMNLLAFTRLVEAGLVTIRVKPSGRPGRAVATDEGLRVLEQVRARKRVLAVDLAHKNRKRAAHWRRRQSAAALAAEESARDLRDEMRREPANAEAE